MRPDFDRVSGLLFGLKGWISGEHCLNIKCTGGRLWCGIGHWKSGMNGVGWEVVGEKYKRLDFISSLQWTLV
jgi:hypothetical protein